MCKCKGTDVFTLGPDSCTHCENKDHFYCEACGDPKDYCKGLELEMPTPTPPSYPTIERDGEYKPLPSEGFGSPMEFKMDEDGSYFIRYKIK